jgi:hypothetical protein
LAAVILCVLGVLVWLMYPEPPPPRLTITALDTLVVAGEPIRIRAILEPEDAEEQRRTLDDLEVAFWETPTQRRTAVSDGGAARVTLDAATEQGTPFSASHVSVNRTYEIKDRARAYVFPKDAPVLLVEVEETLADLEPGAWSKSNPIAIAVRPDAAEALTAARTKHGYRIVYVAARAELAKEYRRVRGWIDLKSQGTLPPGPVLGRVDYPSSAVDASDARRHAFELLRERFRGPLCAVVRTAEAAEQCQALQIRPLAMGGGDFPAGVTRLAGWADLPAALGK